MLNRELDRLAGVVARSELYRVTGELCAAGGLLTSTLPAAVGDHCDILPPDGPPVRCEVIGFREGRASLAPFDPPEGVRPGMEVVRRGAGPAVPAGPGLLGRVIDGLGRPVDGRGPLT